MKKICLIDSTYPINTRTNKIYNSLIRAFGKENVFVIAWNRDGRKINQNNNYYIFEKNAPYGNKFRKLIFLFSFMDFIQKVINEKHFDVVIASHWETLVLVSKIKPKDTKLLYENLDIPTASNFFILKLLQYIERKALKKTDAVIFASRFFVPLYDYFSKEKFLLENKPDKQIIIDETIKHDSFNVVFLGVIRYLDVLKNLVDAIDNLNGVRLIIWGDGPDYEELKRISNGKENAFIKGRYENSQLAKIYSEADLIWAVYPNEDFNVKYAISNKFHESINIGKPCIYADKTELGKFVNSKKLGFIVNPYSVTEIKALLEKIKNNREDIKEISKNLRSFKKTESSWNEDIKKIENYIMN